MAVMAGDNTQGLFAFGVERIIDGMRTRLPGGGGSDRSDEDGDGGRDTPERPIRTAISPPPAQR